MTQTKSKHILCIRLLNWPIDRLQRSRKSPSPGTPGEGRGEGPPLVLVRTIATRQIILAVNDSARSLGIRLTMTLGEARALCAHVEYEEHNPARDAKSLEALARWMMRFSPIVSLLNWEGEAPAEPHFRSKSGSVGASPSHSISLSHGIFLDLTGCEQVFHGLQNILHKIKSALGKMNITARLAIAQTPAASWALTFSPYPPLSLNTGRGNRIDDLPIIALRLDPQIVESLHHLGLETIGQLLKLPRELLPARFGPILTLRLDQLLGHVPEPLVPLEYFPPISARMDFDGPVDSLEAVWVVFKNLIGQIVQELLRRGRGAREIELEFYRAYAQTIRTTVRLSRPSRDPVNLFNLMRCAFETIETDEGFLGIALRIRRSERICEQQIHLLGGEEFAGELDLAHLIERLCVRLGEASVVQPELIQSHLPECAYSYHGFSAGAQVENPCHVKDIRPLHLLHSPIEIRVMVSPSDDREGRPVMFNRAGEIHSLVQTVGPERIAGQWWQGHYKTRDYFDVEDESGMRFWIFRVRENGKWFLQGEFE